MSHYGKRDKGLRLIRHHHGVIRYRPIPTIWVAVGLQSIAAQASGTREGSVPGDTRWVLMPPESKWNGSPSIQNGQYEGQDPFRGPTIP